MDKRELEGIHRAELCAMGAITGRDYTYYTEIDVEARIQPMVELLNSRWTVTLNSCGGHYKPGTDRFQYPYVHFAILEGKKTAWRAIAARVHRLLRSRVTDHATLFVQTSYVLPETRPSIFIWRFCPAPYPGHSYHFGSDREFRLVLDKLLGDVHAACSSAMRA